MKNSIIGGNKVALEFMALKSSTKTKSRNHRPSSDSDESMDKDETEIELERLVFGDDVAFHEGLKSYSTEKKIATSAITLTGSQDYQDTEEKAEEEDLEGVDDADVCLKN